jgi:methyl-accepting chemotaxis protein
MKNLGLPLFRKLPLAYKSLLLGIVTYLASILCAHAVLNASAAEVSIAALAIVFSLYVWWAFHASMKTDLRQLQSALELIHAGDLRSPPAVNGSDELANLALELGGVMLTLSSVSAEIRSNAALVSQVGGQLNNQSKELSTRTEQQAASLEETSACLEEISSVVQLNAENSNNASAMSMTILDQAKRGVSSMEQAVKSVEQIKTHSTQMQTIMEAIDRLASQTTILALNASIEAARAGEQGRGFAVVAAEVRSLAQRSGESAHMVRKLMSESSTGVDESLELIQRTSELLHDMADGIQKMAVNSSEISKSSHEQSTGLNEVTIAVQQLDQITQKNARMVDEAVADAIKLGNHGAQLMNSVSQFKLQQGTADEAIELVKKAREAYSGIVSKTAFFNQLTHPQNTFYDKDMYIFALDNEGHYLAFGGQPAKVNTRVQDIPGIAGQQLVDDIIQQASQRPGWVEYDISNPLTGKVQTKMSFVQQLDDFYIGCGVYKSLAH